MVLEKGHQKLPFTKSDTEGLGDSKIKGHHAEEIKGDLSFLHVITLWNSLL